MVLTLKIDSHYVFFFISVRQQFAVHEDGAFAYQLQNQESKSDLIIID